MANVGDKIRIIFMSGEPQYSGKEGVVTHKSRDPWGDTALYGTWGGLAVYESAGDRIEVIK